MSKHPSSPVNSSPTSQNTNSTLPDTVNSDAAESATSDGDPTTRGDGPLPEEVTGRASYTGEDLVSLMANDTADHITDGFRAGNGDDPETDVDVDDDEQIDLT
jgi:hypothetical protein